MIKRAARWAVVVCCLCSCAESRAQKTPPVVAKPAPVAIPAAPQTGKPLSFTIQLIDGKTREVLAGATARVISDNGIRCIRAPCPNQQRSWEGRADAEGGVHVPQDMIDTVMTVMVDGYRPETVRLDAGRPKRVVSVHLVPK